jgi:hypothetical protein
VGVRWPEVGVALFLMVLAGFVITDSLRVGTGWGDDGPRSGYFPFYIGLALMGSSAWVLLSQLRRWSRHEAFAEKSQLQSVWSILWPMTLYVALITQLGIYVSSVVLIAYFMLRHGKHNAGLTAAVALGVPLVFFVVFERWFLVPLPKGPLEAMLGF